MIDIISAIDQATGCHQCGQPLGGSPSSDFCSESCQRVWHSRRAVEPIPDPSGRVVVHVKMTNFSETFERERAHILRAVALLRNRSV